MPVNRAGRRNPPRARACLEYGGEDARQTEAADRLVCRSIWLPGRGSNPDFLIQSQESESPDLEHSKGVTENCQAVLASCLVSAGENGPDLAAVVEAWPDLPEHVRKTILMLVDGAKGAGGE